MMLNVAEQNNLGLLKKINLYPNRINSKCFVLLELLVVVGGWKYKDDLMSSST